MNQMWQLWNRRAGKKLGTVHKKSRRARRNRLNRSPDLGLEALEPRWVLTAGALDTTFNPGGLTPGVLVSNHTLVDDGQAVAMQTIAGDTKILIAGTIQTTGSSATQNFGVARYNLDGSLDTTFGVSGLAAIDFAASQDNAFDMVVDSLGRIIVVGSAATPNSSIGVARLTANGTLDATFGTGGKTATTGIATTVFTRGVALQSDGSIVVVGTSQSGGANTQDFLVVRYTTAGALDTSFNTVGWVATDFDAGTGRDNAFAVAIQADGKIVVGGSAQPGGAGQPIGFGLARYNSNGTLDSSFDGDGKAFTDIVGPGANNDTINALVIQNDGKIVVAGQTAAVDLSDVVMARYTTSGALDTATFNSAGPQAGVLRVNITSREQLEGLIMQPDGKFVAAGFATTQIGVSPDPVTNDDQLLILRVNVNGTLDAGFGTGGITTHNFAPLINNTITPERYMDVALQPDGKAVAGGRWGDDFVLARYDLGLLTAEAGGPYAINEPGGSIVLNGSQFGGSGPITFEWDLDGDNVFGETGAGAARGDEVGASPTFNVSGVDGPNDVFTVTLRVTDSSTTSTDTATIQILNVDPTLTLSGAADVSEGSLYTLNLSSSDPGADTITSWTINWGDGSQVVSGNPANVTHTYADGDAGYTISAMATDEDGTFASNAARAHGEQCRPDVDHQRCSGRGRGRPVYVEPVFVRPRRRHHFQLDD